MNKRSRSKLLLLAVSLLTIPVTCFAQGAIPLPNASTKPAAPATAQQAAPATQAPPTTNKLGEQDHEELRLLLRSARDAANAKNFDALKPLFYDKFTITTVDQQVFTDLDKFKAYFASMFSGDKAPLKSITFNPEADALTEFVGDNIGVSHGTSTDTYAFSDGDTRTMTSRWTATLIKDNGKWKILNLHFGTNLLDNPVVNTMKSSLYKVGGIAGVVGLIVGFGLAWVMRRRR
jgi:hypothetical protein